MPQAPSYMSPGSEFDLANQQANRQRQLAQMLREQSAQPLQGQMAGQIYVPPSWTQGLAKLLQGYTARKTDEAADTKLQDARTAYNTRNSASTQALVDALSGTPAQKAPEGSAQFGDIMETPDTPAQPPDINKALGVALGNQDNPLLAGFAGKVLDSKLSGLLPKTPKWEKYEKPDGRGGMVSGFVDINSQNPLGTFQQGGAQPAKREFVNGQGVNPYTGDAQGPAIPKQADAPNLGTNLVIPGPDGSMIPNAPLIDARKQIAASGKTSITNNLSTAGPLAFEKQIAELDAKKLDEWRSGAEAANDTIGVVQSLRDAEKRGAYSGGGSNAKLAAAKIINGFTGVEPQNMVGSELYNAEASKLVLAKIKMLGANPSNADRDFIEKTVPQLSNSSQARKAMADFMEKKAKASISIYKRADEHARKNGGLKGFDMFQQGGAEKAGGWSIEPVN